MVAAMARTHRQLVAQSRQPHPADDDRHHAWSGEITWRETAHLREVLYDELKVAGFTGVRLDVRGVRLIDQTGIALLIGAKHRAAAAGRRLILIDSDGPVTAALRRAHVLPDFTITRSVPGTERLPAAASGVTAARQVVPR